MKKILYAVPAAVVLVAIAAAVILYPKTVKVTDYAMNTQITITAKSRGADRAVKDAISEVKRIDSLMSPSLSTSDICRINSAKANTRVQISPETYSLIEMSLQISQKTDGAFDISVNPLIELWDITSSKPRIPSEGDISKAKSLVNYRDISLNSSDKSVLLKKEGMSISLGAVAKGYAADRAVEILRNHGVKEAIVDLGGNVYVLGDKKRIGIQTPFKKRGEYFKVCTVSDKAVVTCGAYERYFEENGRIYHHIFDPNTGYPASSGIKSVTVICANSALADALSTALFVSGEERAEQIIAGFDGAEAIILTDDNRTLNISGN
ncbi:MAG: FAD:protein FMN transferase [Clostridia bacterium]|nr:FAD:protein FMN transferase [Clostridia bacterium]